MSKIRKTLLRHGITRVEFISENRLNIIQRITCILEQRLSDYLQEMKSKFLEYSSVFNVRSNLMEINAILRRLGHASSSYPEHIPSDDGENELQDKEVDEILQSFGDNVLYSGYDGDKLYAIATDQKVKESLEARLTCSGIKNINFEITIEDKLPISELSKPGVPLHGAKLVYVNEGVEAFNKSKSFSTTGSLMQASNTNKNSMVFAVTCRHSVENVETCYTLIENTVVTLGQNLLKTERQKEFLHDDIAVVQIDDETRSIVDEKCEKLLFDCFENPTPARIASVSLQKGDIVHKRGAASGLTTGIVKNVKMMTVEGCILPSCVIFIIGRESKPFADRGDSGSLVFQHSLDPDKNVLEVYAMVQGKMILPILNADVICFPFNEGCESLKRNEAAKDLQNLQFFGV